MLDPIFSICSHGVQRRTPAETNAEPTLQRIGRIGHLNIFRAPTVMFRGGSASYKQ